MKQVEAIIFDWAGTMVDYGCMAPIHAMQAAFSQYKLYPTINEIKEPMGMLKSDHIKKVLEMPSVVQAFQHSYGRDYQSVDLENIYNAFEKNIFATLADHTKLISGALEVQEYLRDKHIKIGTTTGYTKAMMQIVASNANQQGYKPDAVFTPDDVVRGRPYPYMLQRNLAELDIVDVRCVIKVGDTLVDIEEGLNAGCWSVGVILGSSMLGLSEHEVITLPNAELIQRMRAVKYEMLAAGADYVIDSISELPFLTSLIQKRINTH